MTFTKLPIPGPYKGVITDLPSATDNQAFDDVQNMFCRKGRLQTRPQWVPNTPPPDGAPIRAIYSFQDALNNYHTLLLTVSTAYFLTSSGGTIIYNQLNLPPGLTTGLGGNTRLPYALREMNQRVFFSNGTAPLLYVDGSANTFVAGDVPGSPRYLTENSEQLIGAYWTIPTFNSPNSAVFPTLLQFSDTGNPNSWTPNFSSTAMALNLIDSGGAITGLGTIGRNTYVLKKFGAAVVFPTGQSNPSFDQEPFMWSQPGWGNFYPYSLVVYGPLIITITESAEVLTFDGSNFSRLTSGKIRAQLAQDLKVPNATEQVICFATSTMGPGYDLEAYWISIPQANIIWVHDFTEGTWQRMTSAKGFITSMINAAVL